MLVSQSTTINVRAHQLRDALAEGEEIPRRDLAQLADDMIGWAETLAVAERDRYLTPSPLAGQARHYKPVFDIEPARRAQIVSVSPSVVACLIGGSLIGGLAAGLLGHLIG